MSRLITTASVTFAVLAIASCGGGTAKPRPFHPEASTAGYTVVYAKSDPAHPAQQSVPCAGLSPNGALSEAEQGLGGFECTQNPALDVQSTDLSGGKVALWGLLGSEVRQVKIGQVRATTKGHTWLAVIPRPADTFEVQGFDASGRLVDSRSSNQLPPTVPFVGG